MEYSSESLHLWESQETHASEMQSPLEPVYAVLWLPLNSQGSGLLESHYMCSGKVRTAVGSGSIEYSIIAYVVGVFPNTAVQEVMTTSEYLEPSRNFCPCS